MTKMTKMTNVTNYQFKAHNLNYQILFKKWL